MVMDMQGEREGRGGEGAGEEQVGPAEGGEEGEEVDLTTGRRHWLWCIGVCVSDILSDQTWILVGLAELR